MERTIICLGCGSETAAKFAMLAADKRWHVRAYARDPEAFKSRLRDPYLGELSCEPIRLENAEEVRDAIREGTDAVVYFSGDEEEERHVSKLELVTQIVQCCRRVGCSRFLFQAGSLSAGPNESFWDLPLVAKVALVLVAPLMGIDEAVADDDKAIQLLTNECSDIDWTTLRTGRPAHLGSKGKLHAVSHVPRKRVSYADLAQFAFEELSRKEWVHRAPYVDYVA